MGDKEKSCKQCKFFGDISCPMHNKSEDEKRDFFGVCNDFEWYYPPEFDMRIALKKLSELYWFICPKDTKELLVYKKPIYVDAVPLVHDFLEQKFGEGIKTYNVDEVINHLKRSNYVDREEINNLDFLKNRLLFKNVMFNLETEETEGYTHKNYLTFCFNAEYTEQPKKPVMFLYFLKQIQPKESNRKKLQEIMGYCLLFGMPFHKIFWWYGEGRNGKGRVILTLQAVLGKGNYANIDIDKVHRRFILQKLYGKTLNISSEPTTKYTLDTTTPKKLSGEDEINAEIKHANKTKDFINCAKVIVLGNKFPKIEDNTTAWWERTDALDFPISFNGENGNKPIRNIERNWLPEEINDIAMWMLQGLKRLLENEKFTESKSAEETKTEFMKLSDPFKAWTIEQCEIIPNSFLTREEVIYGYNNYCDELGVERESKRDIYKHMRKLKGVSETQKKIGGKPKRGFLGLRIKTENELERELNNQPSIDDMFSPTKENEVIYRGKKEQVDLPKKWHMEKEK